MSVSHVSKLSEPDAALLNRVARLEEVLRTARGAAKRDAAMLESLAQECTAIKHLSNRSTDPAAEKAVAVLSKFFELEWHPLGEKKVLVALAEAFNVLDLKLYAADNLTRVVGSNVDVLKVAKSFCTFYSGGVVPSLAGVTLLTIGLSHTPEIRQELAKPELRRSLAAALFLHHDKNLLFASRAAWLIGVLCRDARSGADFLTKGTLEIMEELVIECQDFHKRSAEEEKLIPSEKMVANRLSGLRDMITLGGARLSPQRHERMLNALMSILRRCKKDDAVKSNAAHLLKIVLRGIADGDRADLLPTALIELPQLLVNVVALDGATPLDEHQCRIAHCFDALDVLIGIAFRDNPSYLEREIRLLKASLKKVEVEALVVDALVRFGNCSFSTCRSALHCMKTLVETSQHYASYFGTVGVIPAMVGALNTHCPKNLNGESDQLMNIGLGVLNKVVGRAELPSVALRLRDFAKAGGIHFLYRHIGNPMAVASASNILTPLRTVDVREEAKEEAWRRRRHLCIDRAQVRAASMEGKRWMRRVVKLQAQIGEANEGGIEAPSGGGLEAPLAVKGRPAKSLWERLGWSAVWQTRKKQGE
jgi:hypothetical protein